MVVGNKGKESATERLQISLQEAGVDLSEVEKITFADFNQSEIKPVTISLKQNASSQGFLKPLHGWMSIGSAQAVSNKHLQNSLREVAFYRAIAEKNLPVVPRCVIAEKSGNDFLLLLDGDLKKLNKDSISSVSLLDTRKLVLSMIECQSAFWGAPDEVLGIRREDLDQQRLDNHRLYQNRLDEFIKRFGGDLSEEQKAVFAVVGHENCTLLKPGWIGRSVVNGNCRSTNLVVSSDHKKPEIKLHRWDRVTMGNALVDVATLLASGLPIKLRQNYEAAILAEYQDALALAGIDDYSIEDCWADYRLGALQALQSLVLDTDYHTDEELVAVWADRHSHHALDMDVQSLFS